MAGRQVITGVIDEKILFGKIGAVGSRKYDYPLGCGVFLSRPPFLIKFIFGFYFHNVDLAIQCMISKENRISEKRSDFKVWMDRVSEYVFFSPGFKRK